jgi:biopolymer transport protein ExbD
MKLTSNIRLRPDHLYAVPLLNLVLLLLLYFILNSSLVIRSGVQVQLPASASALPPLGEADVLTITAGVDSKLYYNKEEVTWENLPQRLKKASGESRHVILFADELVSSGMVIRAQDMLFQQGRIVHWATKLAEPQ